MKIDATVPDARSYLRQLSRQWSDADTANVRIRINDRLVSTVARWIASENVIEVSAGVPRLNLPGRRRVIGHEAAHGVVWRRFGRVARPHGPEWRALMEVVGLEPSATLVRCGERRGHPRAASKYRHRCPVCQFTKVARRSVLRWRCPECRAIGLEGVLVIERVAAR